MLKGAESLKTTNVCNEESQQSPAGIAWIETFHTFFCVLSVRYLFLGTEQPVRNSLFHVTCHSNSWEGADAEEYLVKNHTLRFSIFVTQLDM